MKLEELVQLQVLKLKASATVRGQVRDALLDEAEAEGKFKPIQMCAKVAPELYESLGKVCDALSITKREFIESAVSDAVQVAEEHLSRLGDDMNRRMGGV